MTTQSSSYKAIDYAKFIFSILVIALHCGPFECVSADASYYFTQCVTRVAVPFSLYVTAFSHLRLESIIGKRWQSSAKNSFVCTVYGQ